MSSARRKKLISILLNSKGPVTGTTLANYLGVSRQVIVQDIAILRAQGSNIIATPQGYILFENNYQKAPEILTAILAVRHSPEQTEDELLIIVACGLKIIDVVVEHPVYGEIKGLLMLENSDQVKEFIKTIKIHQATLLSSLTGGIHLHTVQYCNLNQLEKARQVLAQKGFLVKT